MADGAAAGSAPGARCVRADLDVGDELTIGLPNRYFIDGQVLLRPEREVVDFSDDGTLHESLAVCAPLHYWTWKASPSRNPVMQWWPVEYAWAYRDAGAPGESAPTALDAMDEQRSWLDRVRLDASQLLSCSRSLCERPARSLAEPCAHGTPRESGSGSSASPSRWTCTGRSASKSCRRPTGGFTRWATTRSSRTRCGPYRSIDSLHTSDFTFVADNDAKTMYWARMILTTACGMRLSRTRRVTLVARTTPPT